MLSLRDRLSTRFHVFTYNFGWSSYVNVLDGWVARASMFVPAVGYLILFNDTVVRKLTFLELTSGWSVLGLSAGARLKLVYLGLVLLGLANLLFRWFRPHVLRVANDRASYVEFGMKNFTVTDFFGLNDQIQYSGSGAYTIYGKYYTAEWDTFLKYAIGSAGDDGRIRDNPETAHWVNAKAKFEGLLRSILLETFFRQDTRTRRVWLSFCLLLCYIGYLMLFIPSFDLFLRVMLSIFQPFMFGVADLF